MPDNDSPFQTSMIALHEMYQGLRDSGFTRSEALELVARMMSAQPGGDE